MAWFYFGPRMWLADILIGVGLTAAAALVMHFFQCDIEHLLSKDATALYGALLTAETALLGFVIAAVSIIAGLIGNEPFFELRRNPTYEDFWTAFAWTMRFLAIASLVSLASIFVSEIAAARLYVVTIAVAVALVASSSLFRSGINLDLVLAATRRAQRKRDDAELGDSH